MYLFLLGCWQSARSRWMSDAERGDVPGWVLITMMTAGIVVALWVVAEPTLRNLLTGALDIAGDPNK
ncbi:MAG TPA: hypothetical protein VHV76_15870 [Mycobacteriales bacterium]|jgi:hypothetical protein|nr:hypothetical protein [Mycobacteriales bacterium]